MGVIAEPAVERFFKRVEFIDRWYDDGVVRTRCLVWTGNKRGGYGRFSVADPGRPSGRRLVEAHRWLYEHWFGPIPDGHDLDHLCHNADAACPGGRACEHRACLTHTQPVPHRTNLLRGQHVYRGQTHCKYDHEFTDENTKWVNGYRYCRACIRRRSREWAAKKRR
ncbi:HNH endonuclease [Kocuria rosea]|uniref:HNH endonuclease n=1 Tax=Kocuria rosea TaxID=1275 RepID=UPI003D6D1EA4